jgi:hypothetical protein
VPRESQNFHCFAFLFQISKFKWPIQTIEHDFHIEISLEIKFYFFLNFFANF